MLRNIATVTILVLFIFLSFFRESATSVKPKSDIEFSALNAFDYLKEIAQKPHPIGSEENIRVKEYLIKTLEAEGLTVKVESGYVPRSWKPTYKKFTFIENIIATLPGTKSNSKKVVIAGHYDSVVEGPGAADDGYAVASMIETVRLLKNESRENDIVLLITDGEEYGLLGAKHYVTNNDVTNIGVLLNYEARGNAGPGIAFEMSENNAWLVDQISTAYRRPISSSLSYEIYKLLPNATDFTEFKELGVAGINHAFIDGFSYYHHPHDDVDHISKKSIQHTGENMYLAAKHFSNYDFNLKQNGNAIFFNFYGLFPYFPASYNLFFLILTLIISIIAIGVLYKREDANIKHTAYSFFSIIGLLLLASGLSFGMSTLAKAVYPQYATFYSYQYYNHVLYFAAGLGIATIVTAILGRKIIQRLNTSNLGVAATILMMILTVTIYNFASTGAYVFMFPLLAFGLSVIARSFVDQKKNETLHAGIGIVGLVIAIGFWASISYSLYLAFSLSLVAVAIIPFLLFTFISFNLAPSIWQQKNLLLPIGGFLLVGSLLVAHIKSKPTKEFPLKSNLFYAYDGDSNNTYVGTHDKFINDGHLGLFAETDQGRLPNHLNYSRYYTKSDIDLSRYRSTISENTTLPYGNSSRTLVHPKRAFMTEIAIDEIANIDSLFIDGVLNKSFKEKATGEYYSPMFGIGLDSLKVTVSKRDTSLPVSIYITTQYAEMPNDDVTPDYIIRDGGMTSTSELVEF